MVVDVLFAGLPEQDADRGTQEGNIDQKWMNWSGWADLLTWIALQR